MGMDNQTHGEALMPNGYNYDGPERRHDAYNPAWCKDKHRLLDQRIDKLDARMWTIMILLFGNLAGIGGIFVTLLSRAGGV